MNGEVIFFVLFSLGAIIGAVFVLVFRKAVYALLSAVLTFVSMSGLYILLTAEFVAGVQLLIYSGAITILMLFAIMLTKQKTGTTRKRMIRFQWPVIIPIVLLMIIIFYGIHKVTPPRKPVSYGKNNTEQIGELIFTQYMIPFEMISVLLLAALIGAIILAKKENT
ncbi:NADH-quinone oxidoreductase subunit J [Fervidibacillus halotolerans]|uniref:NADH-quinone oxidoreductase subunit J n=1 Tax=Fervidibacillus halotolerans TaxID=2980027 RepID=A0A9E8S009_9BACI|nr:NADH-quinone oxidoreductase subunit J [Fervidibacillus halotolerans]WAA12167.1 NADH-quinone oxidoreductase subunit J [Fervidibacillus halotolerans]